MKILLVHKFFKYSGGADVFFFEVGRVLEEHGHEVAYFSTQDKDNIDSKWNSYFSDAPHFNTGKTIDKIKALIKIPYNLDAKKKFAKLLEDFKPDLVHAFGIMTHISPSVLVAAKEKNIPVVISLNDYKHICPNYKLFHHGKICEDCKGGHFYHCILNKCSHNSFTFSLASSLELYVHKWMNVYKKNVTLYLFASDFMANKTKEFWNNKIEIGKLLNPFKVPAKPDYSIKREYGLYFGRLVDEKGVDILLKALAEVKNIPFTIIGDGPEMDNLQRFASEKKLENVEFVGPKWGKELDTYLSHCKYVVVPSIWPENFPYVIIQAFAAGKPVIGAKNGGIPELVTYDRGYLYDPADYLQLAERMKELDANPSTCESMGENARIYVENTFNDIKFYEDIILNYQRAVELNKK